MVRTRPLVGEKAWFGPRRLGWGLEPTSVEGWVVTVLAVTGVALARRSGHRRLGALLGALLGAVALAKGTAPGGPRARRALLAGEGGRGPATSS